jgi:SNF2 family DNA or RNA helicase
MYVPMVKEQRQMYQSIVDGELAKLLESATGNKSTLNNVMMQLRKCALHPYLHYEPHDVSGEHGATTEALVTSSGKLQVLDQMLRKLKKDGHKVLVFSQFTTMLDIIEDYLTLLRPGMKFCRIDGSTKLSDRREQMDEFNDPDNHEKFVFLLSTRAGGVGINLAAAGMYALKILSIIEYFHVCVFVHFYVYVRICICICMCICICICICTSMCICICMFMFMYMDMYTCEV